MGINGPRILVAGQSGQLAHALGSLGRQRQAEIIVLGRPIIDIADRASVDRALVACNPDVVINAAAYTAVDRAEQDAPLAFRINGLGAGNVADAAAARYIPVIHVSTDYVFDGLKATAYTEDDPVLPLSVYGASKAAGETAVRRANPKHLILRTSWVYGRHGANFVKTMLRLAGEAKPVRVVADQYGCPTAAEDLARAILDLSAKVSDATADVPWGTYHLAGTGTATWHGIADKVFAACAANGRKVSQLEAIATDGYPLPARRPANSVLDCSKINAAFGITLPHWTDGLNRCLADLGVTARERHVA